MGALGDIVVAWVSLRRLFVWVFHGERFLLFGGSIVVVSRIFVSFQFDEVSLGAYGNVIFTLLIPFDMTQVQWKAVICALVTANLLDSVDPMKEMMQGPPAHDLPC